jgi:hypothetical protein
MPARTLMSTDDAAELDSLFEALPHAFRRTAEASRASGISRRVFPAEDVKVAEILTRINKLLND